MWVLARCLLRKEGKNKEKETENDVKYDKKRKKILGNGHEHLGKGPGVEWW